MLGAWAAGSVSAGAFIMTRGLIQQHAKTVSNPHLTMFLSGGDRFRVSHDESNSEVEVEVGGISRAYQGPKQLHYMDSV